MSLRKRLRHRVLTRVLSRTGVRTPWSPRPGPPEGLSEELLTEVHRHHRGRALTRISHEHLSGWKRSGAYRVYLATRGRASWSVIYKTAEYDHDDIPALRELPFAPGPSEHLVYSRPLGPLAAYAPAVYHCAERTRGEHYTYILEDLAYGHERALDRVGSDPDLIVRIAAALPAFQRALRAWADGLGDEALPSYGAGFTSALPAYFENKLHLYADRAAPLPDGFLGELPGMLDAYTQADPAPNEPLTPIHGDFHVANIFLVRGRETALRLVDWEWAGLGRPHMDLASLLKLSPPELEQRALAAYAAAEPSLAPSEHASRYEWCQLERGLLDAAFLAAQEMHASNRARFSLSRTIDTATRRATRAYRALESIG